VRLQAWHCVPHEVLFIIFRDSFKIVLLYVILFSSPFFSLGAEGLEGSFAAFDRSQVMCELQMCLTVKGKIR
jgi:hypothetical protein